jgi:hypothetical protein
MVGEWPAAEAEDDDNEKGIRLDELVVMRCLPLYILGEC